VHSVRVLLDLVPFVLVEQRGIPRPGYPAAVVPLAGRLARREDGAAQGGAQQQHERVPMPHDSQLLADVPEGAESWQGYC
jgi:hypothetical protein